MNDFSHYDETAGAKMVDVSSKNETVRTARASGFVIMSRETVDLINKKLIPKGDPFETAKVAGIMAAKRTFELIPMCHPLFLSFVDVKLSLSESKPGVYIESEIKLTGRTGAEMEALTAVSAAALTIYDMCKAVDKEMVIEGVCLIEKTGGKSDYKK